LGTNETAETCCLRASFYTEWMLP